MYAMKSLTVANSSAKYFLGHFSILLWHRAVRERVPDCHIREKRESSLVFACAASLRPSCVAVWSEDKTVDSCWTFTSQTFCLLPQWWDLCHLQNNGSLLSRTTAPCHCWGLFTAVCENASGNCVADIPEAIAKSLPTWIHDSQRQCNKCIHM